MSVSAILAVQSEITKFTGSGPLPLTVEVVAPNQTGSETGNPRIGCELDFRHHSDRTGQDDLWILMIVSGILSLGIT